MSVQYITLEVLHFTQHSVLRNEIMWEDRGEINRYIWERKKKKRKDREGSVNYSGTWSISENRQNILSTERGKHPLSLSLWVEVFCRKVEPNFCLLWPQMIRTDGTISIRIYFIYLVFPGAEKLFLCCRTPMLISGRDHLIWFQSWALQVSVPHDIYMIALLGSEDTTKGKGPLTVK